MDNIVSAKLDSRYASTLGVWQYDYGQVLRITGPELPLAVEVQFSLDEKSGETLSRVGTTVDGVTEVKIPDELLTHSATSNYRIYAYIYLTDETSGSTKYEIIIPVRVRSKPTSPAEDPETDPDLFRETVVAVNASAERAKMAEQNAKESAAEAGKYAASASESAVTAEKTKEDALRKVGEKKREAIEAIQNQEETSVGKITAHTDDEIQRIQNQAAESKGELEQTIINAGVSKEELEHSIETAGTSKTALDKSVELAGTAKTELDTSTQKAGEAKTALDGSARTAGEMQETLSATAKQAGALDASLGEEIETGTQLKTDLIASSEKAVQDIQTAGSEQLGKMQAVAEAFTADREQIANNKEDIGSLKEGLGNIISPNLYNPTDAKENTAIDQNVGSEVFFDGWIATGYIPVSKGEVLYFSSNGEPTPYSTGAFYDKNKQRVDSFGNPNNNNIAVTSDGYARFSFNSKKEKLQIEKGSRTTYIPYGELKIKPDVDNVNEDIGNIKAEVSEVKAEVLKTYEDHSNLFNKDTVTKDSAILSENGYFYEGFSGWDASDYIPVKPGMVLYFSSNELPIGVVSTGAYFDANRKYLSGVNNEPTELTVPDGAYYFRFSKNGGFGDILNTLKIEQYGITKYTPYGELYVTVNESALPSSILPKWKGLKILTLGDSITAMGGVNGWTHWIKQYLLADKVVNVSVAGSTWQDKVANQTYDGNPQPSTDGNVMGNQVQKVLNAKANGDADYQDFDVITFSFGTNDSVDFSVQTKESVESQFITNYAQNNFTVVPIDNVNRQTLAGAIRYGFQKLHEAYPNAVIFMCTPTQECYETFDSIYQKGDFINFVADRCGAETIDTRRCGIRNIYESQTTIDYDHPDQSGAAPIQTDLLDGIHTNENGAKKIAKYNARGIMKYFMIN